MKNELQVEEIKVKNSEVKTFKIKNKKKQIIAKIKFLRLFWQGFY